MIVKSVVLSSKTKKILRSIVVMRISIIAKVFEGSSKPLEKSILVAKHFQQIRSLKPSYSAMLKGLRVNSISKHSSTRKLLLFLVQASSAHPQ